MKRGLQTIILLILGIMTLATVMTIFHWSRKANASTYTMDRTEEPGESETSGCSVNWGLTGDQICDDETNTEECHFDLGDCCDGENDFSLCSDCFCYSAGHNTNDSIINDCIWQNPLDPLHLAFCGDGKCDPQLNNIQNLFDLGDCCYKSPDCQQVLEETLYWGGPTMTSWISMNCPENVCIKSDAYCIEEFMGDGICDGINNSPYCQYDLQDCLL